VPLHRKGLRNFPAPKFPVCLNQVKWEQTHPNSPHPKMKKEKNPMTNENPQSPRKQESTRPLPSEFVSAMVRINPRLVAGVMGTVFSGGLTKRLGLWDKKDLDDILEIIHATARDPQFVSRYMKMINLLSSNSRDKIIISNIITMMAVFHTMVAASLSMT